MNIETREFIRGGKSYYETMGINSSGQSVHYIDEEELDPKYGNVVRWVPIETIIRRTHTGGVAWIKTIWGRFLVSANGTLIEPIDLQFRLSQSSNPQDILYFIGGFGVPIMMSEGNGWIRDIKGFNKYRLWNPQTGQLEVFTTEQMNEEPTKDYWG